MPLPRITSVEWCLRIAVAFAFLYPPIAALGDPYSWIGYFPTVVQDIVAPHSMILLHVFGVIEVALAVWVLLGKRIFIPAVLSAAILLAIVIVNASQFAVLFRDISIALVAVALALANRPGVDTHA